MGHRKKLKICPGGAPSPSLFGSPLTWSDWSLSPGGYSSQTPASWSSLLQVKKHKRNEITNMKIGIRAYSYTWILLSGAKKKKKSSFIFFILLLLKQK